MSESKKLKIFYTIFKDPKYLKTIQKLENEYHWKPLLIQTNSNLIKEVKDNFHNSVICNNLDVRRLEFDYSNFKYNPIDSRILENLSNNILNFLSFSAEDVTGKHFSFKDRKDYFYKLLNYWNTFILNLKPDIFVSTSVPHDASTYTLYLLCKYHYKIPVLFLEEIFFFDKHFLNIGISVEDGSAPIYREYKSLSTSNIHEDVQMYLNMIRSKKADMPSAVKQYHQIEKKNNSYWRFLKNFFKSVFLLNLIKDTLLPYGNSFNKKIFYFPFIKKNYYEFKSKRKFDKLEKWYESNSINQLENDNYIYYPAPFHPESISNVRAGYYEDPILILEMLDQVLPNKYKIYYKEHPAMWFVHNIKKIQFRDQIYYERIKKIKKVQLVSSRISTFELMDRCKAVATATATTGWEAVIRGKPVFTFSKPWYSKCSGVFEISDFESLNTAMAQVANNFKPDKNKVDLYAQAIYNISSLLPHVQPIKKYFLDQGEDSYLKLAHEFKNAFKKNYEEQH